MNMESIPHNIKDLDRERALSVAMEVAVRNFDNHSGVLSAHDRAIMEKMESNRGEIGGRSALAAEVGLREYVKILESKINENIRILNSNGNFNSEELNKEIATNQAKISMFSINCLNTLAEINKNL